MLSGDQIAFGARVPALEAVGGEELDIGTHPAGDVLLDRRGGLGLDRGGNDQQGGCNQAHQALRHMRHQPLGMANG